MLDMAFTGIMSMVKIGVLPSFGLCRRPILKAEARMALRRFQ